MKGWEFRRNKALQEFQQSNLPLAQFEREARALMEKKLAECEEAWLEEIRQKGPAASTYKLCHFTIPHLSLGGWGDPLNSQAETILWKLDKRISLYAYACKDSTSIKDCKRHHAYDDSYMCTPSSQDGWGVKLHLVYCFDPSVTVSVGRVPESSKALRKLGTEERLEAPTRAVGLGLDLPPNCTVPTGHTKPRRERPEGST